LPTQSQKTLTATNDLNVSIQFLLVFQLPWYPDKGSKRNRLFVTFTQNYTHRSCS